MCRVDIRISLQIDAPPTQPLKARTSPGAGHGKCQLIEFGQTRGSLRRCLRDPLMDDIDEVLAWLLTNSIQIFSRFLSKVGNWHWRLFLADLLAICVGRMQPLGSRHLDGIIYEKRHLWDSSCTLILTYLFMTKWVSWFGGCWGAARLAGVKAETTTKPAVITLM